MTTANSVRFVRSVQKLSTLPDKVARSAVQMNAARGVANAERAVKQATNGSSRLRNAGANVKAGTRVVGKAGAALKVTSKLEKDGKQATVKAVGPWQLIERDTKQHFIGPAGLGKAVTGGRSGRGTAKARTGRATALRTPYGPKRWVYVKGTKGKFPWKHGFDRTTVEAPQALAAASKIEVAKMVRR